MGDRWRSVACVAVTAAVAGARLFGLGDVHHDRATADRHAIQACDSGLGFLSAGHFDKGKTFGAAGVAVHHDFGRQNAAKFRKVLTQAGVVDGVRQVAHVNFAAHG
mgnify:CR=1 FL=1